MNMVGMDVFLADLRRVITGPLDIAMEEALFEACVQFCRRSELITLSQPVVRLQAGQEVAVSNQYDLQACNLLHVLNAAGEPLRPGLDYHAPSPDRVVALVNLSAITLWYAAEPRKDNYLVPELLDSHYRDVIAAGGAAILYLQPDRPWTDPARAGEYQSRFVEGLRQAMRFRKEHAAAHQVEFRNPTRQRQFF